MRCMLTAWDMQPSLGAAQPSHSGDICKTVWKPECVQDTFGQMSYYQTQCLLKPMVSHHVPNRHEYATSGGFGAGQVCHSFLWVPSVWLTPAQASLWLHCG